MRISLSGDAALTGAFQSTAHNFRQQVFSRAFRRRSACDGGGSGADAGLIPGPHRPASLPMRTHSGLIRFFSKSVMSQSDGTALRRSASETADSRMPRATASSARVLHAAASKTRRYCEAKSLCGGKPYGAGVSDMALSGVAGWRLPKAIAGS